MKSSKNVHAVLGLLAASCSTWAYQNVALEPSSKGSKTSPPPTPVRATFDLDAAPRVNDDVVVCLALSGGGSRAAWFSSAVMFELAKIQADPDVLSQVDVMSSVSGGSLASAYYATSQDPSPQVRLTAAPHAALPACAHAKLEFNVTTRILKVTGPIADEEATHLRAACAADDTRRIDRLVLASRGCVSERNWDEATVRDLMTRNYDLRLFGNFFWPTNIALYWFTAFDRGDIMAQTFADNLFDTKKFGTSYGRDLTYADLNPVRPLLILNSTDGTDDPRPDPAQGESQEQGRGFGDVFAFTRETFASELDSDLAQFPISYAVMSSASFPGAFPYRTMRNFKVKSPHDPAYVHVFDGGNSDNLGLLSLKRVIKEHELARKSGGKKPTYIVISVDSYTEPRGARPGDADPRSGADYVVDSDFFDAIDMLLKLNRYRILAEFMTPTQQDELNRKAEDDVKRRKQGRERNPGNEASQVRKITKRDPDANRRPDDPQWEPNDLGDRLVFWHLTFRDLYDVDRTLYNDVNAIATDFKIDDEQATRLETAAKKLVGLDPDRIVERIQALLAPH